MAISKKQLIRLVRLVARLKENRYPNCKSFAEQLRNADIYENINLACTEKTVYRDIQILKNDFDAPIEFDKRNNGYYLTHHNWAFSCPQVYDDSEMLAAVLGARVAENIMPEPLKSQIRNSVDFLLTTNNPDFLNKSQVASLNIIPANNAQIEAQVFLPLFEAWQLHETVNLQYTDSKGEASSRRFDPMSMIFYEGTWYVKGYCHLRNESRTFALPRVQSVNRTGDFFKCGHDKQDDISSDDIFDSERINNVVVICDAYLKNILQVKPLHLEQSISERPDGQYEVKVASMSKYRLIT